jgi:trk system potassium uptake protein
MKRQVLVVGLGRFGTAVATELTRIGHEVLAVDLDSKTVQAAAEDVTHVAQADATDEEALAALGSADFDACILAVGSVEASVLACVILKRLGARRVIAKASSTLHAEILRQVGADRVVFPEAEMGFRVAHTFGAPSVADYLDVTPSYGIAQVAVGPEMAGRSIAELDLGRLRLTPLIVRRGDQILMNPSSDERLRPGDELIIAGRDNDIAQLTL